MLATLFLCKLSHEKNTKQGKVAEKTVLH